MDEHHSRVKITSYAVKGLEVVIGWEAEDSNEINILKFDVYGDCSDGSQFWQVLGQEIRKTDFVSPPGVTYDFHVVMTYTYTQVDDSETVNVVIPEVETDNEDSIGAI